MPVTSRPEAAQPGDRRTNSKLSALSIIVAKMMTRAVPASSWRVRQSRKLLLNDLKLGLDRGERVRALAAKPLRR
jgi:hypothetical protein